MQRQPEPELMDDEAQALAYASANFDEPHAQFISLLKAAFPNQSFGGWTLDLGCGPADITRRFALAFPAAQMDGIDGAEAMLTPGRQAISAAGLETRVTLWHKYLPQDAMPRPHYHNVICNSLLHHLKQPMDLWHCIAGITRPGARIFVMDLLRPVNTITARQLVELYAADEPDILQHDFYHSLLAAYSLAEVQQQLQQAQLTTLHVHQVSDRHFTVAGII